LLREDLFHGEELSAEDGSAWMALIRTASGHVLRKVTITVQPAFDPYVDVDESEPTGKRVETQELTANEQVVFLVRGIPQLVEGPVQTLFEGSTWLVPGYPLRLGSLSGRTESAETLLAATGTTIDTSGDCCACPDYRLELRIHDHRGHTTRRDELASVAGGTWPQKTNDTMPTLQWAGDLDRDGTVDLLIDFSPHYSVSSQALFLSSAAAESQIVAPVATLERGGC
jgi:hypothetical protein